MLQIGSSTREMTLDKFFGDNLLSKRLFDVIRELVESLGDVDIRVTKSQIAFRRRRAFAWVWMPGQYLTGNVAPLVLTVSLPWRDASPRWKEIVEPSPGRFTHHVELFEVSDIDPQVSAWLRQAWEVAA